MPSKPRVAPTAAEMAEVVARMDGITERVLPFDRVANYVQRYLRTTRARARQWLLEATEEHGSGLVHLQAKGHYLGSVRKINRPGKHWYPRVDAGRPVLFSIGQIMDLPSREGVDLYIRINPDGSFFDSQSWRDRPERVGLASEDDEDVVTLLSTLESFVEKARVVMSRHSTEHEMEGIVNGEAVEIHMGEDYRTIKAFLDGVFINEDALKGRAPEGKGNGLDFASVNISLYNKDIARFAEGLRILGVKPEPRS